MKKQLAIIGANGKMGTCLCKELGDDFDILKVDINDKLDDFEKIDLVVDFASAESSVISSKYCFENHIPLIVGSTGQTQQQMNHIEKVSSVAPLVVAGNFSIGIAILKRIIQNLSLFCDIFEDVVIFEKHHKNKKDSPSGTAKELNVEISKSLNLKPQMIFERGGQEIGTHKIDVYFGDEVLSFSHKAFSRRAFSKGVRMVAKKIFDLPAGKYDFKTFV